MQNMTANKWCLNFDCNNFPSSRALMRMKMAGKNYKQHSFKLICTIDRTNRNIDKTVKTDYTTKLHYKLIALF